MEEERREDVSGRQARTAGASGGQCFMHKRERSSSAKPTGHGEKVTVETFSILLHYGGSANS